MTQKGELWYRADCEKSRTTANNKQPFNLGQVKSSTGVVRVSFADRLKDACGTDEVAEIARTISRPYQTVKNYLTSDRKPDRELLLAIHKSTGVSIHWLLTGEGSREVGGETLIGSTPARMTLDEAQIVFIERLATFEDVSFGEMVKELIYAGLDMKSRELSVGYRGMNKQQLEDVLDAILGNTEPSKKTNHNGGSKQRA